MPLQISETFRMLQKEYVEQLLDSFGFPVAKLAKESRGGFNQYSSGAASTRVDDGTREKYIAIPDMRSPRTPNGAPLATALSACVGDASAMHRSEPLATIPRAAHFVACVPAQQHPCGAFWTLQMMGLRGCFVWCEFSLAVGLQGSR